MAKLQSNTLIFDIYFEFDGNFDSMTIGAMKCNLTQSDRLIGVFSKKSMLYYDEYLDLLKKIEIVLQNDEPDFWQPISEPEITIAIYPDMYFPFLPSSSKIIYISDELKKEFDKRDKLKSEKIQLPYDDFTVIIEYDQFTPGEMYTGDGLAIHMRIERHQLETFLKDLKL